MLDSYITPAAYSTIRLAHDNYATKQVFRDNICLFWSLILRVVTFISRLHCSSSKLQTQGKKDS